MSTPQPGSPRISPDGHLWWDGQAWQPMPDGAPAPSLASSNEALPPVTSKCTSTLPPPCKDALIALDKAMTEVDQAMTNYQRDIPVCIGRPVQQFKDDWIGMEQGVVLAVSGFNANS